MSTAGENYLQTATMTLHAAHDDRLMTIRSARQFGCPQTFLHCTASEWHLAENQRLCCHLLDKAQASHDMASTLLQLGQCSGTKAGLPAPHKCSPYKVSLSLSECHCLPS